MFGQIDSKFIHLSVNVKLFFNSWTTCKVQKFGSVIVEVMRSINGFYPDVCLYQECFYSRYLTLIDWLTLKSCTTTSLFGWFQDGQENKCSHKAVSFPRTSPSAKTFTIWFSFFFPIWHQQHQWILVCCTDNRVLCDLCKKTTFCYGYTNKSMSGFPTDWINLIIVGTYYAYSKAILVIQSYNGDL